MVSLYIILFLIVVTVSVLAASIKVRFQYAEVKKSFSMSYLVFGILLNFENMKGRFTIARFIGFNFDLRKTLKRKKAVEKPKKKKAKKKKWLDLSYFKIKYLQMAKNLIDKIKIKELMVKIGGGFAEPFTTGKIYGLYWAARGIIPKLMSHIVFTPDFSSEKIDINARGEIKLRLFHIIAFFIYIIADMTKEKIRKIFVIKKRGVTYA